MQDNFVIREFFMKALVNISEKRQKTIVGVMSGTSMDGLDVALCRFEGSGLSTTYSLTNFKTVVFQESLRRELKAIVFKEEVNLRLLTRVNSLLGKFIGQTILECLEEWHVATNSVDLIASHGQTVYHAVSAKGNSTLQLGDGDQVAVATGIVTLSDFRQKNIAAGGAGAPLVVYGDYLLFSSQTESRILLNIGGISNLTYLPAGRPFCDVVATDIGPGNTLMDASVNKAFPDKYYDHNAEIALTGAIHQRLLAALLDHPFFTALIPKTTGPELFNLAFLEQALNACELQLGIEDTLATLCYFSARCIADVIASNPEWSLSTVYVSGGGFHNPLLIQALRDLLPQIKFYSSGKIGMNPDAKEAVLFALLANETFSGSPQLFATPGSKSVSFGKISLPW